MDRDIQRLDAAQAQRVRDTKQQEELLQWTSNIVAAYLSKNQIDLKQLPQVMDTVYGKLSALGQVKGKPLPVLPVEHTGEYAAAPVASVGVDKSVTPDYIICLEDGVRLKTLKRYLNRKYKITPEQYRMKWGLPPDYPMVAPNYAAKRSALARKMGLGRKRKSTTRRRH